MPRLRYSGRSQELLRDPRRTGAGSDLRDLRSNRPRERPDRQLRSQIRRDRPTFVLPQPLLLGTYNDCARDHRTAHRLALRFRAHVAHHPRTQIPHSGHPLLRLGTRRKTPRPSIFQAVQLAEHRKDFTLLPFSDIVSYRMKCTKLLAAVFALLFLFALTTTNAAAQQSQLAPTVENTPSATTVTSYTLPPDKLAKAKALYILRGRLRIIDTGLGFIVLLGILYLGVAARYRDWAERVSQRRFLQALIFIPLLLITVDLLGFP